MNDRGDGSRISHGHTAALVVAAAHIAIPGHFSAAFHFGGRHGWTGDTGQQRRSQHKHGREERNDSAAAHLQILSRTATGEQANHMPAKTRFVLGDSALARNSIRGPSGVDPPQQFLGQFDALLKSSLSCG